MASGHESPPKSLAEGKRPPGLAVIQVGTDPASAIYVRNKRNACKEAGIVSFAHDLPSSTTAAELEALTLMQAQCRYLS